MKFLCLSYMDEQKFEVMSESERETFIKECLVYDNVLRKNGNFVRLEGCKARETPRPCATRTARYPSPTARSLKPRNK